MRRYTIYILTVICIFACNRSTDKKPLLILQGFYKTKSQLLQNVNDLNIRDSLRLKLNTEWEVIMENRSSILRYLLSLENDTSYSIYGEAYSNINPIEKSMKVKSESSPKRIKTISNKNQRIDNLNYFTNQKLPNYLHSLYLIECIIQDDYLFNRRYLTKAIPEGYFVRDDLNFIYDGINGVDRSELKDKKVVSPNKYSVEIKEAWSLYKKELLKLDFKIDSSTTSPIMKTRLKWYSKMEHTGENKTMFEIINKKHILSVQQFYHLDFIVGDRWGIWAN